MRIAFSGDSLPTFSLWLAIVIHFVNQHRHWRTPFQSGPAPLPPLSVSLRASPVTYSADGIPTEHHEYNYLAVIPQ
jgi:hypothetical protein